MEKRTKPRNRQNGDIRKPTVTMKMIHWTLMTVGIMLLQQIPVSQAERDDACKSKGQPGICKTWSECPILKTLIERGEYNRREVVGCGFEIVEELICCPTVMTGIKIENSTPTTVTDRCETKSQPGICTKWNDCPLIKALINYGEYTTEEVVSCGFDVLDEYICCPILRLTRHLENSTSNPLTDGTSTATKVPQKRDFWLDVLENLNNSTTTTTTTTQKPDFWLDFVTSTTTTTTTTIKPLIIGDKRLDESSEFFDFSQLLNQKKKNATSSGQVEQNRDLTHTGGVQNSHLDDESQNSGGNWNNQAGRGFPNNNGNAFNGARGPGRGNQNIGRGQNNNPNRQNARSGNTAFIPQNNNNGPNNFNGFFFNGGQQQPPFDSNQENERIKGLKTNIFDTSESSNREISSENWKGSNVDDMIFSIFSESKDQANPAVSSPNASLVILWTQDAENPNAQVEVMNPNQADTFTTTHESMPYIENPMNEHDLEAAPSTYIVFEEAEPEQTWHSSATTAKAPSTNNNFNPIQTVFQNLVDSGMNIVKAKSEHVQRMWNQQQESFPQTATTQQFGQQPEQFGRQQQQFGQQPQQFGQQPQQFGQQTQQFGQQTQQFGRQPQQFGQQPQQFGQQTQQFGRQTIQQQPQFGRPAMNTQQPIQFGRQPTEHRQEPSQQFQEQQSQFGQQPNQASVQFDRNPTPHFGRQTSQNQAQTGSGPKQPATTNTQFFQESPNGVQLPNIQSPPNKILDPFKPFEFRPSPDYDEDDNSITRPPNPTPDGKDRPAVIACRRIERGLTAGISNHILGGTPAELGEFPHMAAIGYSRIGDNGDGPYDIRCGGTLIDSRFVLTAAHCVASRDSVPAIVRLGAVNFTDPEQMRDAVEIKVKETHIHDDYSQRQTYNDIAILELEQEVNYNKYIYPVCLYTEVADPNQDIKLYVTGWGTVNTSTRAFSDILLKAPLHVTPLERCNDSFIDYGLTRQIDQGIIKSQLCAEDKDQTKDACQGDSGGPLNLVVDESYLNYRVVGVVSSGFGCASSTPGLYTRVAAFLDYIERIVWPNGGA